MDNGRRVDATTRSQRLLRVSVLVLLALQGVFALGADEAAARPEVLGAGEACLLSQRPGQPIGTGTCPGVRPGALVDSEEGGGCTLNFLFKGSDRRTYIGTAGHCIISGQSGEEKWRRGDGPAAVDSEGKRFGEYAYAIKEGRHDFALIRVDRGVKTDPQMCFWGGPTGLNKDASAEPVTLEWFGQGSYIGRIWETGENTVPARSAVALGLENPDHVYATGPAIFGDSGSAVISEDGRAIGDLVTGGFSVGARPSDIGYIGISRLAPNLQMAQKALRIKLKLRTAGKL